VAPLTPAQMRTRDRVETLIRIAAPALDLLLAVGDRLSRLLARGEPGAHPAAPDRSPLPPAPR
jgi:hypothetical protein